MTPDAPPGYGVPGQEAPAARHGGFLTTLPGILTAVAAVITALSGGLGIYLAQGSGSSSGGALGQDAEPVPVTTVQADPEEVAGRLDELSVGDEVEVLAADCAAGSVDACTTLMDRLVDECYLGDASSCDALYWISPLGSAYEDYGATCGGRYDWTYAGACSEP